MTTNLRMVARLVALGRMAVGVRMMLQPEEGAALWIGRSVAAEGGTKLVTRAFGARDFVLGLGALQALRSGDGRDWVMAGGLSDSVDFIATAVAEDIPPAGRAFVLGLAAGAATVSFAYAAKASS